MKKICVFEVRCPTFYFLEEEFLLQTLFRKLVLSIFEKFSLQRYNHIPHFGNLRLKTAKRPCSFVISFEKENDT